MARALACAREGLGRPGAGAGRSARGVCTGAESESKRETTLEANAVAESKEKYGGRPDSSGLCRSERSGESVQNWCQERQAGPLRCPQRRERNMHMGTLT